jgi:hypothetical protein
MPGYVAKALHRFQRDNPLRPEYSPHQWPAHTYLLAPQMSAKPDKSPTFDDAGRLGLQEVTGTLLYYARAVDCTMLVALGSIAAAKTTQATSQAVIQLLNYAAINPDATPEYKASDMCLHVHSDASYFSDAATNLDATPEYKASNMCLHVHSDASYLSESKARSRVARFFFISSTDPEYTNTIDPNQPLPPWNGTIHAPSLILKVVVSSAAEAELGTLFFNAKDAASCAAGICTQLSNNDIQKPWTCASTGYATASPRSNLSSTGVKVPTISPTTLPTTIKHPSVGSCVAAISCAYIGLSLLFRAVRMC